MQPDLYIPPPERTPWLWRRGTGGLTPVSITLLVMMALPAMLAGILILWELYALAHPELN